MEQFRRIPSYPRYVLLSKVCAIIFIIVVVVVVMKGEILKLLTSQLFSPRWCHRIMHFGKLDDVGPKS